jgi:hypothetical protein
VEPPGEASTPISAPTHMTIANTNNGSEAKMRLFWLYSFKVAS